MSHRYFVGSTRGAGLVCRAVQAAGLIVTASLLACTPADSSSGPAESHDAGSGGSGGSTSVATGTGGQSSGSGGATAMGSGGTGGKADAGPSGSGGVDAGSGSTGGNGSGGNPSGGGATGSGGSAADAGTIDAPGGLDGTTMDGSNDGASGGRGTGGGSATGGAGGSSGSLQIWPLGDSITFGYNGTNAGYRGPLYNLLKKTAPNVLYVGTSVEGAVTTSTNPLPSTQRHNDGHGSYTINDINNNLDGLDSATFDKYGEANRDPHGGHWLDGIASGPQTRAAMYPDFILLMIGTNNANDSNRTTVRNQLHALLTKLTTMRPNAKLVVAQITPSNLPNNVSYNSDVAAEVQSLKTAGKQVSLVDMYTKFPSDGLYSDNLHPNDKGFAFMAQQWLDAMVAVMPSLKGP